MKTLASREETKHYGSLGYRFSVPEMISQLKVMHDDICDDMTDEGMGNDYAELEVERKLVLLSIRSLEEVVEINGNDNMCHDQFQGETHGY